MIIVGVLSLCIAAALAVAVFQMAKKNDDEPPRAS